MAIKCCQKKSYSSYVCLAAITFSNDYLDCNTGSSITVCQAGYPAEVFYKQSF